MPGLAALDSVSARRISRRRIFFVLTARRNPLARLQLRSMETRPLPLPLPDQDSGPHHLASLAAEVHRTYFFKVPPLPIFWGQQIRRKNRRSIRLGSHNHLTRESPLHPLLQASDI